MISKTNKRTGWLRAWYSKVTSVRRRSRDRGLCKLRGELLERRELLSATVVLGAQIFKTIPIVTTNGSASGTVGSTSYTADPNLTGTIAYSSPTQGTINGSLNGPVLTPANAGNFAATVAETQNTNNSQNLSGSVKVTAPASLAGTAVPITGNLNTSTLAATVAWSTASESGSWSGTVVPSGTPSAYRIIPTTPEWDPAAPTQIDFGFTVAGTWYPVPSSECGTPLAYVRAYWASGTNISTMISEIGSNGDTTIPVYWNQASGTASIQGISSSSIPAGANYVLIQVEETALLTGQSTNLVAFNLQSPAVGQEIMDNSQPGFWSSLPNTWTTTSSGLNGSSLISSTVNGSKQSQAAWWFSMPAGVYQISVTYTAGSNLTKDMGLDLYDGVGNWIGQIPVNEQIAPNSFTEDGVAWENLGSLKITSNVFHISTWNSSTDGAICVNGIQLQAAPVIDDSNAPNSYTYYPTGHIGNFTTTGAWTTSAQGAFGGSHVSSITAGSGTSTATWTMPVTPGSYEVDVTWPASASLSASATYSVSDGITNFSPVTVDQQTAPSDFTYEGQSWQSLGSFAVTGTQLIVTLANTGGQVVADAIRILPAYHPTPIVGSGDYPGFWSNSAWTTQDTGLYGESMVSNSANGSEKSSAAWWFPVQPGEYDVEVTWVPGSGLSTKVPFDVYNALTYISEPLINEQYAPSGVTDQGVVWQSLGVFTMTSNVLHVSTWNSPTDGAMCVDGVRIVPFNP